MSMIEKNIKFSFLALLAISAVFTGCKTGELENRLDDMERHAAVADASFRAGDYSAADAAFRKLASQPTVSSPLYRLNSIPCLILSGRKDEAHRMMQELRVDLEELYDPESEKKALSKWHGEINKVFKGSPHEMTAFYALLSLSYAQRGEYEDAWRCVQNGLLHDTDAKEDKFQSDDALLLYLGAVYADRLGEVDSAAQCRKRLRDSLASRGITAADIEKYPQSPYATLLKEDALAPNAFLVFWSGTPPQFGRSGKYGETRTTLKGAESTADFLTVSVDGGKEIIVPEKIGDVNFQATTRGGRMMDNILADKADFKQDMKNFQEVSLGLSGFCFAAAAATFSTSKERLIISGACFAAGVTFLVLDGVFYCFYDKTDPRADIRAWKTLPGQLNILPLRLTPGRHKLTVRSRIGGDAMSATSVSVEVPDNGNAVVAHVASMDDGIINDTLRLLRKTVEIGNKNAPKEICLDCPQGDFNGDSSSWYSLFGEDFLTDRVNVTRSDLKDAVGAALIAHGYTRRWKADDAVNGVCPVRPDKTLVCLEAYWNVTNAVDGTTVLDTRVTVAVRGAGDCTPGGKIQTGPVKFFYAWSRQPTTAANYGAITDDEKTEGIKVAVDNLFRMPDFRLAMLPNGLKRRELSQKESGAER